MALELQDVEQLLAQQPLRSCMLIPSAEPGIDLGAHAWVPGVLSFQFVLSGQIPTTPWHQTEEHILRRGALLCCAAGASSVRRYNVARRHLAFSLIQNQLHVHLYQRRATDPPASAQSQQWQLPVSQAFQQLNQLIEAGFRERFSEDFLLQLMHCVPETLRHCLRQARQPHLRHIREWMTEHLTEDLSRDDLAQYLGCHPDHVTRLFREQLHSSFALERKRMRCALACDVMSVQKLSLRAVAQQCGFSSEQYLIRSFRELFGCTPRQWLQRQQQLGN